MTDPETGYISSLWLGKDLGHRRCDKCGGKALWGPTGGKTNKVLCLRCADDWNREADTLLKKHNYKGMGTRKWLAAWQEFCQIPVTDVDIEVHNQEAKAALAALGII